MIETNRLKIYSASKEQMEALIAAETDEVMRIAYTEMLSGALTHPEQWDWYAIWMIELKDGTHIGDLCFKGISENGSTEIGYGIADNYQGHGYATEAVSALVDWAFKQPDVTCVTAETEESNTASQRVLDKAGFMPTGKTGEEGPLFVRRITIRPEEHKDYKDIVSLVLRSLSGFLIVVKDIKKAEKYYHDLFGLKTLQDNDGNMILSGGLVLQEEKYWRSFIGRDVIPQNNACELYFEEVNIDAFYEKLKTLYPETEFVNLPMTHSWGQRVVRFYDLDGNLIEVGTSV